jgi:CBS-domain-containing membrane protein
MKAWIPLTLVFALGLAAHAQATCTYPQSPAAPPNGNTATRDEMIAAKHDFDRYNGEMNVYLDCLNLEMDASPKDLSKMTADEKKKADQESKILVQRHNAAVDELQAVVGRFNEQLKIYKAKNK